jgi:hypothetical protein
MNKLFKQSLFLAMIFCLCPLIVSANGIEDITHHFDQPQGKLTHINFRQKEIIKPVPNDFELIESAFMSNNIGDRYAVVTIENTSPGQRILKNEHIVATFANGRQSIAHGLYELLKGGELLTKTIFFGSHSFPIVRVQLK